MRLDNFLMWFDWLQFESVPKFTLGLAAAFVFGISFGILVTAAVVEYSSPSEHIGASVQIASGKHEGETAPTKPASEMVWCGARKGRAERRGEVGGKIPATLWT